MMKRFLPAGLAVALGFSFLAPTALARPYATSLTNDAGIVSFRLNEDADNVKVIWNNGANSSDLGALPKGLTVTGNLGVSGTFKVQVTKNAGPGYLQGVVNQISDDANNFVKFSNQRGLAVNKNPASPYFGRVYVSVSAPITTGGRTVSDGIYVLNADQTDALGQGDTPRTGGIVFDVAAASAESPGRLSLGPDGSLYIADWSDANGGLTMTDADVATNTAAVRVLQHHGGPTTVTNTHGSISSVWVEGSLAGGDLVIYSQDEDLGTRNGVYRYDIGAGPLPYTGEGTLAFTYGLGAQLTKIVRGPDGKWYGSNRRAEFATSAGVFVLSADGSTVLWNSISAWRTFSGNPTARDSYFGETRGIDVSPDGKYLVSFRGATNNPVAPFIPPYVAANTVLILPLENGVPNITNLVVMETTPFTAIGRDIAFDAVGNIYTVSSGQGLLRIYSPGGFSQITTGSDGGLDLIGPTEVTVTTDAQTVFEGGPTTAALTFTRSGLLDAPLTVAFTVDGTAVRGSDYVLQINSVTLTGDSVVIPAGQSTVVVSLVAQDDSEAELTETVTVTVTDTDDYSPGIPFARTIAIADNETPELRVVSLSTNVYERLANDYATLTLRRYGDTNVFLQVDESNLVLSGTAVKDADYALDPYYVALPLYMDVGVVNASIRVIYPIDNALVDGPRTVTVGMAAGGNFTVATNTATTTIVDDDWGTENVVFSETFSAPESANNWFVYYADTNTVAPANDATIEFGYNYSWEGIPAAPGLDISDTYGLYLKANVADAIPGAVAINVYPKNKTFAGNYALRFDMYMVVGQAATTEYTLFGINHSGTKTNWFRNSAGGVPAGWTFDGLFYGVESDAAALGDYVLYSSPTTTGNNPTPLTPGRNASTLTQVFKAPPFAFAGAPSNPNASSSPGWVDVEVSQIGGVVTLRMNKVVVFSYTNTTPYTSGNIMLGYTDAYDSIGSAFAGVVFDNVRVVQFPATSQPNITEIKVVGANVEIYFTAETSDAPSAFGLQAAGTVNGTYGDVTASITQESPGNFKVVRATAGTEQFYRIKRL